MKSRSKAASHSCTLLATLLALAFLSSPLCAQDQQVNFTLRGRWPGFPRGRASDVAVLGQYAYLSTGNAAFLILDISNPAQPVWLKNFDTGGVVTTGAACFATVSNRVYVTRGDAGLAILDVTQPLNPVRLGVLETGYSHTHSAFGGIQVVGDYAYVMWWDNNYSAWGVDVVDIRKPAQPVRTGSVEIPAQTWDFQVLSNHAYVATGDGLWIVDVSNRLQPVLAGSYQTNRWFWDVALSGPYVCVAMKDVRMVVLDVSNPVNPTAVETYLGEAGTWSQQHWIQAAGNYAYLLTDHDLEVLDIRDPTRVTRAGGLMVQLPGEFQVVGDYGYLAAGSEGLQLINLSNPQIQPGSAVSLLEEV